MITAVSCTFAKPSELADPEFTHTPCWAVLEGKTKEELRAEFEKMLDLFWKTADVNQMADQKPGLVPVFMHRKIKQRRSRS